MKRYTHKPTPIIAIQFTGDNMDEITEFLNDGIHRDAEIKKDDLIKRRFILFGWSESYNLYFKQGDYFFSRINKDSDVLVCGSYVVEFFEQSEFEREYSMEVTVELNKDLIIEQLQEELRMAYSTIRKLVGAIPQKALKESLFPKEKK